MNKRNYNAFTLAEVLITLAIIAIVAALTIPAIVQKYKELVTVSKVKKAYSLLNQAYQLAKVDYGELENWDLNATDTGAVNDDGLRILDYSGSEKIAQILAKYINSASITESKLSTEWNIFTLTMQQNNATGVEYSSKRDLQLNDGTIIRIGYVNNSSESCIGNTNACSDIALYTDSSLNKQQGVNCFYFYMNNQQILPAGYDAPISRYSFKNDCNSSTNSTSRTNGRGCTAWIIQEGNMNYLDCNDLELNGSKKECR